MGYGLCEKAFGGGLSRSQGRDAGQGLWEKSLDKKLYGGKMRFMHLLKTLSERN